MGQAADYGNDSAGPCRPEHVLGGFEVCASMLVVDDDEFESGVGAHFDDGRTGQATEDPP